jgi:hypothetical protein
MKSLRGILVSLACAWLALPAFGAVELDPRVGYRPGLASDDAACEWEPGVAAAVRQRASAALLPVGAKPATADRKLSLQVIRYEFTRWEKKSQYLVGVRADVTEGGKLVATRDFQYHDSFRNEKPGCDTLKYIGGYLGGEIGKWILPASFVECGEGCAGIHPEETIVVGTEVQLSSPEALNSTVRDDCRFQTKMAARLVEEFNGIDYPPLRAKLEPRDIDLEKYSGRRLILRVNDVHALAGGGFSGPKWAVMSGELREGDLTVASFSVKNTSGRGLTTCRSVDSLIDGLTWSIVQWLRGPTLGARLD